MKEKWNWSAKLQRMQSCQKGYSYLKRLRIPSDIQRQRQNLGERRDAPSPSNLMSDQPQNPELPAMNLIAKLKLWSTWYT